MMVLSQTTARSTRRRRWVADLADVAPVHSRRLLVACRCRWCRFNVSPSAVIIGAVLAAASEAEEGREEEELGHSVFSLGGVHDEPYVTDRL